jgi:hypothetical protein
MVPPLGTINKILLQLISARIVDIQYDSKEDDVLLLGLGRASLTSIDLAMNVDTFWKQVNTEA